MDASNRMLAWMAVFVLAVGAALAGGAFLLPGLAQPFMLDHAFGGTLLALLLGGIASAFIQAATLSPAGRWLDRAHRGFSSREPPRLVAALARLAAGREREGFRLSPLAMGSLLDGARARLSAARRTPAVFAGLLVLAGAVCAFLSPEEAARRMLAALAAVFVLAVLELQLAHAQGLFLDALEQFLAAHVQLPPAGSEALESDGLLPMYVQGLLERTTENLGHIERMMARGAEERDALQAGLGRLAERLAELCDQLRAGQKVMLALSKSPLELQPAMAELALQTAGAAASYDEMRAHLRSIDVSVARLVEEVSAARQDLPGAWRQEVRVLAQSLGAPASARSRGLPEAAVPENGSAPGRRAARSGTA